ncbi:MAG: chemotaxis protein CheW, partial [Dehalococcoidales bacterium]|nr:chemotaxis protein CheW [Dehalococcoidales bacterium]
AKALVSGKQLVIFKLAGEFYGVDISSVREIIHIQNITRVPGSSNFVEGVINRRGEVLPVVGLRKRFGMENIAHSNAARIMVVHTGGQDVGMVVDSVAEVLRISSESVEPPSSVVSGAEATFVQGIAKLADKLVILLDIDKLLTRDDVALPGTAVKAS